MARITVHLPTISIQLPTITFVPTITFDPDELREVLRALVVEKLLDAVNEDELARRLSHGADGNV